MALSGRDLKKLRREGICHFLWKALLTVVGF
jgi:hypothetical protein